MLTLIRASSSIGRRSLLVAPVRAQRFTSSASKATAMSLPSPERVILECLKNQKHDKWGWVIYRCTYDDDEGWTRFKQFINQQSRANIAESDTPELADSLEWTFVEDRATLDRASIDQLRSRFKQWAPGALITEQPRVKDHRYGTYGNPRYTFFVHVDEDALKSVVYEAPQPPELDLDGVGYVNFVNAGWRPLSELTTIVGDISGVGGDEVHESIDGCTEENVGWMMIASHMVGAHYYEAMMGNPDSWYLFYKRPPEISNW
jgi:hypothetical protein